jgi:DNA mismatch repair ATPase MutS
MIRVALLYRDRNLDPKMGEPWNAQDLVKDLELERILSAMSGKDDFVYGVARRVLLQIETDRDTILYRQKVLADCVRNPAVVRGIYGIAVDTVDRTKRSLFWLGIRSAENPSLVVDECVRALRVTVPALRRIRAVASDAASKFESEGFTKMFRMMMDEFDDNYLGLVEQHLDSLEFREGVMACVRLGGGNAFVDYRLERPQARQGLLGAFRALSGRHYTFEVDPRDEAGGQVVAQMRANALTAVAEALRQSVDNVLGFFNSLKTELAFYVGCLNLYNELRRLGEPTCFPTPLLNTDDAEYYFSELYDPSLALTMNAKVVGNTHRFTGKRLFVVTGANRGGKTTFLRSVGQAQLLMQAGCFAPAEKYVAPIMSAVYTHFKREEDPSGRVGKLEEELRRMSAIVDNLKRKGLMLFNESFSSTNSREGSEIARQVVKALLKLGFHVFYVSHLYEFSVWAQREPGNTVFLVAQRKEDGTRTFRIIVGEPEQTSHAQDLYNQVFNTTSQSRITSNTD